MKTASAVFLDPNEDLVGDWGMCVYGGARSSTSEGTTLTHWDGSTKVSSTFSFLCSKTWALAPLPDYC